MTEDRTYSVSDVTRRVQWAVRKYLPGQLWIRGEVAGLKTHARGHLFLQLSETDDGGRRTHLDAAIWSRAVPTIWQRLREVPGIELEDGVEVRVLGSVEVNERTGRVQFSIVDIDPTFTLGRFAAERDRVIAALDTEGILGAQRSLPVPLVPLQVGIITSAGSAAHGDLLRMLASSGLRFRLEVIDTRMQGETTERGVVAALKGLGAAQPDVTALLRGGGSKGDLAWFDREAIARAICASSVPVWTGIGHEVDTSVADLVAARSFATPTALAAGLVETVGAYRDRVESAWYLASSGASTALARHDQRLHAATRLVAARSLGAVRGHAARLDDVTGRIQRAVPAVLHRHREHLDRNEAQIRALDPRRILDRGYAIVRDDDGGLVRSVADLTPGTTLRTTLVDGQVASTVTGTTPLTDPTPPGPTLEPTSPGPTSPGPTSTGPTSPGPTSTDRQDRT